MRQKTKKKAMFARKRLKKVSDTVTKDAKIVTKIKSATMSVKSSCTKKSSREILSFVTSVLRFSAQDVTETIKTLSLLRRS